MKTWDFIAGEYPPTLGGVADYTEVVANGLVKRGKLIRVWQRGSDANPILDATGIVQYRCAGNFTGVGLRRLGRELDRLPKRKRLLVQYVPQAFGRHGMNLSFVEWVRSRALIQNDDVRIMFHEVAYPWVRWPMHLNILAIANRWMVRRMITKKSRIYVSTSAWVTNLLRLGVRGEQITVLPIPSNVPQAKNDTKREIFRNSNQINSSRNVVGHFGTYGKWVTQSLKPILLQLLTTADHVHLHLIGGASDRFRSELISEQPSWASRISATGHLVHEEVANHIAGCDVMLQPYPDGANTRRTTLMACLINSRPTVSTNGSNSESLWSESNIVRIAEQGNAESFVMHIKNLLADKAVAALLGRNAYEFYQNHFALEQTLDVLTAD